MTPISRRMFLASAAAVAVAACSNEQKSGKSSSTDEPIATDLPTTSSVTATTSPTTTLPPLELSGDPFSLGVASGDPDMDSVVLWTRLAPDPLAGGGMPDQEVNVEWQVSATNDFATIESSGVEVARPELGHSVHVIAALAQGTWFYRFRVGQYVSPIGITRAAPAGNVDQVRFAAASCQHYASGYYAAHRDIAERAPDFLVWLGDYIYEDAGATNANPDARTHLGPEPTTIEEYRDRYARYKTDPQLQASHAACPWFVIWDDHEVENNYAGLVPERDVDAAGFSARRFAAYRAWWEHQPVRLPPPSDETGDYRIYREARWGNMLTIALLDGRQYRSDQSCGDAVLNLEPPCAETTEPERTMLGPEQEQWLIETLTASTSTWNVIGNQVVLSDATLFGAVLNYDQWDGYPAARNRLLAALDTSDIQNLIVLTGDIHLAAVGQLHHGAKPVGVEFVTTSISSGGLIDAGFDEIIRGFPDLVDAELTHRGYSFHTVSPTKWTAELRIVTDAESPDSAVTTYGSYEVAAGTNTVSKAT